MEESNNKAPDTEKKPVILATNPDPGGFFYKYTLSLTPLLLIPLSVIAIAVIYGIIDTFSQPFSSALSMFLPDMSDVTLIMVLMIAPIGIFAFFAVTGWILRFTEMWTGSALSLGLSTALGFILVTWLPDLSLYLGSILQSGPWVFVPLMSSNRVLYLLTWTAFLIQPFSILAVTTVIAWTEKFRRSIHYIITKEGIIIKGGVWKQQEHMLPHHQIGRLVVEQDMVGGLFHTGTIIPVGTAQWGSEMSIRGLGMGGQKSNVNIGVGYAKARQEFSRYPLDCLYGVKDPEKVMALLQQLISRPEEWGEEQVSYLKKIYEKL
jgi:hypothetical protein